MQPYMVTYWELGQIRDGRCRINVCFLVCFIRSKLQHEFIPYSFSVPVLSHIYVLVNWKVNRGKADSIPNNFFTFEFNSLLKCMDLTIYNNIPHYAGFTNTRREEILGKHLLALLYRQSLRAQSLNMSVHLHMKCTKSKPNQECIWDGFVFVDQGNPGKN